MSQNIVEINKHRNTHPANAVIPEPVQLQQISHHSTSDVQAVRLMSRALIICTAIICLSFVLITVLGGV